VLIEGGLAWVLSRLELEMERWPEADEEIVIETWPDALNRLFTERKFLIFDASDRRIGSATTLWLVLDLKRRRPVRLPARVVERLTALGLDDTPTRGGDLLPPDPIEHEIPFTVRRADLDLAGHVNNTSYVEWAVEAVPDEIWDIQELASLEIDFRSECHHGQTVVSRSQLTDRGEGIEVRHQLMRPDDGTEVARARTRWKRR
jgi:acyl-ACP thioesterase